MKEKENHINFEEEFFKKTNIQYSKSKDDVWADMELKLSDKPESKEIKVNFRKIIYSAAAILIVGLGLLSFLKFYSIDVYCPNGQHSTVTLPDGFKVTLNANSTLSYQPYWWQFTRELNFSGEAFFEVKKGEKFVVNSEKASTTVLGTQFNIYSRNDEYKVFCITGKVKVETKTKESTTLMKNDYSVVSQDNKIIKLQNQNDIENSIAWIKNEFIFTSMPLKNIYEEIERQFDIVIDGKENLTGISSFNTKRGSSPEEIINLIGKPFGVKCVKVSDKRFIVEQK